MLNITSTAGWLCVNNLESTPNIWFTLSQPQQCKNVYLPFFFLCHHIIMMKLTNHKARKYYTSSPRKVWKYSLLTLTRPLREQWSVWHITSPQTQRWLNGLSKYCFTYTADSCTKQHCWKNTAIFLPHFANSVTPNSNTTLKSHLSPQPSKWNSPQDNLSWIQVYDTPTWH